MVYGRRRTSPDLASKDLDFCGGGAAVRLCADRLGGTARLAKREPHLAREVRASRAWKHERANERLRREVERRREPEKGQDGGQNP